MTAGPRPEERNVYVQPLRSSAQGQGWDWQLPRPFTAKEAQLARPTLLGRYALTRTGRPRDQATRQRNEC